MHKSQGFGVAPSRGEQLEYFKRAGGRADGALDLRRHRPDLGARAGRQEDRRARGAHPRRVLADGAVAQHPRAGGAARRDAGARRSPVEGGEARPRSTSSSPAAPGCTPRPPSATPSPIRAATSTLTVTAVNRSPAAMTLREVRLPGGEQRRRRQAARRQQAGASVERTFKLPAETEISSRTGWRRRRTRATGRSRDAALIGRPAAPVPSAPSSSSPSAARR